MGLGHELTLMLKSDLFIGTSSGFAALANFSAIPYFITRMNPGSCHAYAIPEGADRLPFAQSNQKLIYAQETSELLMKLLETGLDLPAAHIGPPRDQGDPSGTLEIDVRGWQKARAQPINSAATTSRFQDDDKYRHEETAYLVLPKLEEVKQALLEGRRQEAGAILRRLEQNFPELCRHLLQYRLLLGVVFDKSMGPAEVRASLETLDIRISDLVGLPCSAAPSTNIGWRPFNWVVESGDFRPLGEEPQPALTIRATGPSCYWHTERFVSSRPDGRISVRFDAKNSEATSRHQAWIFEDGSYRSVGELVTGREWRTFDISISAKPGSVLEFQIDHAEDWQWLSIRNVHVIDGQALPLARKTPVAISMASWTGEEGTPGTEIEGGVFGFRQWTIDGKRGYVQTPVLPQPGESGLIICFEARTDKPASKFTAIYLFEGERYRTVAQYAFGPEWHTFSLLLEVDRTAPIRLQVDYPELAGFLSIRNCLVVPVSRGDDPQRL
jgi:hypothetical protein